MYVLTLDPKAAIEYINYWQERSVREIVPILWTHNVPAMASEDYDEYVHDDIQPISVAELHGLVLKENQEIRLDAALFVQLMPRPKDASSLGVFTHEMNEEGDFYKMVLLTYFWSGSEVEKFLKNINDLRGNLVEERAPHKVVESP